jgi:hypothetical protein
VRRDLLAYGLSTEILQSLGGPLYLIKGFQGMIKVEVSNEDEQNGGLVRSSELYVSVV